MSVFDRLGRRTRMALKGVLFFVLAIVTFAFALQATFPYDRVKDRIVEQLSQKYDTKIGSIKRGIIPGRLTLYDITLRTRPAKADDPPTIMFIKSLEIHAGIFAAIHQTAEAHIDAVIGSGTISGTIAFSKKGTNIHLVGSKLPAALLPMKEGIGLPMSGIVAFSVDLDLPIEKQKGAVKATPNWQKAAGAITFQCPSGCTFGDGKTKLKTKLQNARSQAFAADGIDIGKVNVTMLAMRVDIKKGVMTLSQMDTKSEDGQLAAELRIELQPNLDESDVTGCLRFAGSESLLKREPKTYTAIAATAAPFGPDKLYHIKLEGKFRDIKKRGMLCGPGISDKPMDDGGQGMAGGDGGSHRPNLQLNVDPTNPATAGVAGPGTTVPTTVPVNPPPPEQFMDAGIGEQPLAGARDAAVAVPLPGPEGEVNVQQQPRFVPEQQPPQQQPPNEGQPPPPSNEGQPQQQQPPNEGQPAPAQQPEGQPPHDPIVDPR